MYRPYPFAGCGFVGAMALLPSRRVLSALSCDRMIDSLTHRGPEDSGQWLSSGIWMGHRRLSILDLSERGRQPMTRDHLTVVTNGEVYNFAEIRAELETDGFAFSSETDTEVILRAFQRWGPDCLRRFNGIFAFAVWDHHRQELFLARDRLGIKPLYIYRDDDKLLFGSEVQALMHSGGIPAEIDWEMVRQQVLAGGLWYPDQRRTLVKGVHALPAGHYMVIDPRGRSTIARYWEIPSDKKNAALAEGDLAEQLGGLFEDAIRLQLVSDVPVAAFLSGGMDSSMINVVAARILDRYKLTGITVEPDGGGMEIFTGAANNDLEYSRMVAETIRDRLDHRVVRTTAAEISVDAVDKLVDLAAFYDDIRQLTILGNYRVVRDLGFKVVLNGQGADECMGGYIALNRFLSDVLGLEEPEEGLIRRLFTSWFVQPSAALSPAVLQHRSDVEALMYERYRRLPGDPLEKGHRYLVETLLHSILRFEDVLSMHYSVECRVPFLDHRIVEWAFSFPFERHIDVPARMGKMLLRRAGARHLPPAVINRPKQTFPHPGQDDTRAALLALYRVHRTEIRGSEIVRYAYREDLLDGSGAGLTLQDLWRLLVIWRWEEKLKGFAGKRRGEVSG